MASIRFQEIRQDLEMNAFICCGDDWLTKYGAPGVVDLIPRVQLYVNDTVLFHAVFEIASWMKRKKGKRKANGRRIISHIVAASSWEVTELSSSI